jgi:hypothetical protein
VGNDFSTRVEGTRIKHAMGRAAIKLYDKFGQVARVERTANDVTCFSHHRTVKHPDGASEFKLAHVLKSSYCPPVLRDLLGAATQRYLDFLADIEDPRPGLRALEKIATSVHEDHRSYRGFNLSHGPDLNLSRTILRGEFTISGFQARQLEPHLAICSGAQLSGLLKRLRTHGLIKKIGKRYKYYPTTLCRTMAAVALKLRELVVIPMLYQPVIAGHRSLDHPAQDLTRRRLRPRSDSSSRGYVRQIRP